MLLRMTSKRECLVLNWSARLLIIAAVLWKWVFLSLCKIRTHWEVDVNSFWERLKHVAAGPVTCRFRLHIFSWWHWYCKKLTQTLLRSRFQQSVWQLNPVLFKICTKSKNLMFLTQSSLELFGFWVYNALINYNFSLKKSCKNFTRSNWINVQHITTFLSWQSINQQPCSLNSSVKRLTKKLIF